MTSPSDDLAGLLARLVALFRARSAGVDLAGVAAGRTSAAASPLMFASGALDVAPAALSPVGAARSSDMSAATPQAVQTDPAPVPEVTPTSAPISASDRVRTGGSEAFNAANAADPASLASAPQDALAQLTAVSNLRSAHETLRLAQDIEDLFAEDQPPRLPPTPPTMKLPAGRARPAQPPKAAPRTASHRALALSGSRGRQQQQLQQLLLKLLGERTG
jgi:hypothetical protein